VAKCRQPRQQFIVGNRMSEQHAYTAACGKSDIKRVSCDPATSAFNPWLNTVTFSYESPSVSSSRSALYRFECRVRSLCSLTRFICLTCETNTVTQSKLRINTPPLNLPVYNCSPLFYTVNIPRGAHLIVILSRQLLTWRHNNKEQPLK